MLISVRFSACSAAGLFLSAASISGTVLLLTSGIYSRELKPADRSLISAPICVPHLLTANIRGLAHQS